MNYCNIKPRDIADGPGVRVTLFVSGCTHHCKNCFQPETWAFDYGAPFTPAVEDKLLEETAPYFVQGLTLLGGEPMEPENQRGLLPFLRRLRRELPGKDIWCYSGYTWEELTGQTPSRCRCEVTDELLSLLDVLVDGEFVEELHDITLLFRGSANQRLIHVPQTLAAGQIVLWGE
ncbi:anaerobic ribonucleoside-triphosphate reductase activating protein [Vermiculatibacterium agrestimuris]|uniref:anaerobic ribonucleoside-triphosphate reductase activating protein n=1 Tax=Vermiculatibacterium agrestimuris TaxID=2941519 RepID=UPI00203C552C|nr:anaerobic ribonucleoside-triphosphate reductase activating protein [Vermiculatibacterium agrestimuris]